METVTDFIFLGSKITADGDCSHEIKRYLLLGRKAMTNLDSILKSRDMTLSTKVHLLKAMVFPVVIYECKSWTITKAESWRTNAFELWCWWRLLRVPWTARRSNQSILKEINPEYSLEGLMLKLKLQYYGHLMWRTDWFEKTLMLGKIEGGRRSGGQRMRWLNGITHSMDMSESTVGVGDGWGGLACCSPWGKKVSVIARSQREALQSGQRSWGRRLSIRKGGIEPQESPWIFSSIFPQKTRVCLLYCFVLSPLTLLGAVPHHHLALSDKELTYSSN